jgi:predicted Zn-dependent peptidase
MDFIKGLNSNSSLASTLSYHELLMGDYRYFSSYTQQIDKVSAADIQQAAMKYLTEKNRTVAVLKKESKQPQKEMIENEK